LDRARRIEQVDVAVHCIPPVVLRVDAEPLVGRSPITFPVADLDSA
jgi:hypothetical protein